MNRVLIVAYYTPPLGLSGVMRVTKLCKYLPDFGWEPVILTVKPVAYYAYDPGLLSDLARTKIIRTESLDPNRLLMRLRGEKLSRWAGEGRSRFLNFVFFPDAKIGWYPLGISAGKRLVKDYQPKLVFATAPPWTSLLIGAHLADQAGLPFVADFRDPWPTGFQTPPFYQQPVLKWLLKRIFRRADLVLVVNRGTAEQLKTGLGGEGRYSEKIKILENGFDPEEFAVEPERLEGFSLFYAGNLFGNYRQIVEFVNALSQVPEARFYFAGSIDQRSGKLLAAHPQVVLLGKVAHSRVCALMKGADALVYVGKPAQPVGLKLYEYLGANRPILVWGDGDLEAVELVKEFGAGRWCKDAVGLAGFIQEIRQNPDIFCKENRTRLNRRFQAELLAQEFNRIVKV